MVKELDMSDYNKQNTGKSCKKLTFPMKSRLDDTCKASAKYLKFVFLILGMLSASLFVKAQTGDTISLFWCHQLLRENYPLIRERGLNEKISNEEISQLNKNWYPDVSLQGQASYQSDVVTLDLDIPLPGIDLPTIDKDQYKIYLNVNQMIYDGGATAKSKTLASTNQMVNQKQVEVNIEKLIEHVNELYFAAMLIRKNLDLLKVHKEKITAKEDLMESAVKNGVRLPADLYTLQAELIKLDQNISDRKEDLLTTYSLLGRLIDTELDTSVQMQMPIMNFDTSFTGKRKEYQLFELQKMKIQDNIELLKSTRQPKLFAFGQAGYGRPGLNFLNETFDTYYIVGLSANWKIYDWGSTKSKRNILFYQEDRISIQEDVFTKNLNMSLEKELSKIQKLEKALQHDLEIIRLKEQITNSYSSRLEEGVITSAEYIDILNDETAARLQYEIHRVELNKSKINYITLKGEI